MRSGQVKPAGVLLVSFNDRRSRYRFVQDALEAVNIPVGLKPKGALSKARYSPAVGEDARNVKYRCAIFIGGNLFVLLHYFFIKFRYRIPVYLRLGGDPDRGIGSQMRDLRNRGQFLRYLKIRIRQSSFKLLIKWCSGCFTVSEPLSRVIVKHYSARRAITLPRPMTPSRSVSPNGRDEVTLRLLSVANFNYREKYEGLCKLIECLRDIRLGEIRVDWRIIGGGAYERPIREAVNAFLNSDVKINYLGFCESTEPHYKWADVFIYASELDWMPNVLLEAKSFGLPVIIHEFKPLSHVFTCGGALFIDVNSKESVHNALMEILDQGKRKSMAEINLHDIETEYSAIAIGNRFKEAVRWDSFS